MTYDFETLVDRSGSGAVKWDLMRQKDPAVPDGIVPFSVGDMDLKTPPEIVAGLRDYLERNILGYTAATDGYRRAVTDWLARRHGWETSPEWLVPVDGVVPAMYTAVRAFTKAGDGVVYLPPVYRPIHDAIDRNGRRPVSAPLLNDGSGYGIDFAALERALADPGATMLLFCSPHNPVSRVWRRDELQRLGDLCLANDVLLVSDEIHMDFVMPGHRHEVVANLSPDIAARSVVCTAPSKTFNIAGLQVSNIVIPDRRLRRAFEAEHARSGRHGPNQLGLAACRIAYERCEGWLDALLELIRKNGDIVREFVAAHFPEVSMHRHEGTYFVWLDFRAWGLSAEALEEFMVKKARLFLDEGYIFGTEGAGFERINLACPSRVLEEGLRRLLLAKP